MSELSRRSLLVGGASALIGLNAFSRNVSGAIQEQGGQPPEGAAAKSTLPGPEAIPKAELAPTLKTIPTPRKPAGFNQIAVSSAVLPSDTKGVWVLDFTFKPVRVRIAEIPGKGRRSVYYLWYRIVNRTGEPRLFVPQFTLITDTKKKYDDVVLPQMIPLIQAREDGIPLLSAVSMVGMVPPSLNPKVDEAVYGVALWDNIDPHADAFKIYVRGLSDGYKSEEPDNPEKPAKYKTLRLDFTVFGDDRVREREIQMMDPPYEWIYW